MDPISVAGTVIDVVKKIYQLYKDVKDGDDQFAATYKRASDLIELIAAMDAKDKAGLQPRLDQLSRSANALLAYLQEYKTHTVTKILYRRSEMLARIDQFDQELAALFQLYQLAIGAQHIRHSRELLRGMRELLQGGDRQTAGVESTDEYLSSSKRQRDGPVAEAQAKGEVHTLVGLLDDKEVGVVEHVAIALCEMAEGKETRKAFKEAGVVKSLVEMLRGNQQEKAPQRTVAAYALQRLARRDKYEVEIVEAGAVPLLALMLDDNKAGSRTESEICAACAALARLVTQAHHKKPIIVTDNLLVRVVGLVYSGSVAQKRYATSVLRGLANNDELCAAMIADHEAIPVLVDLLYVGETPEVRAEALGALWNLSSLKRNRTEIAEQCGIKGIVEQLRNGDTDEHCQLAASTLTVLAQDDENDKLIGAAGGIDPLVRLLVSGTPQQRNSSVWALAELANDTQNAIQMVNLGATRALWAAFCSASDTQRRSKAGLALMWIATLIKDKAKFESEIGLKNIVKLLSRGLTDQKQNAARILGGIAEDSSIQLELAQLGVIPMLIKLVAESSQKQPGVDALCALARGCETNRTEITEAGGIDTLINVMDKNSDDQEFESAVEALKVIACTPKLIQQLVDADGINILLQALKTGSTTKQISAASYLADFVKNVKGKDSASCVEACESVFVDILENADDRDLDAKLIAYVANGLARVFVRDQGSSMLKDNRDLDAELVAYVANGLARKLVRDQVSFMLKKNMDVISPKIYTKMLQLLNAQGSEDLKTCVAETLCLLSSMPDLNIELDEVNGLSFLVALAERGSSPASEYAAIALIQLSRSTHNQLALTKVGAIKAVVRALNSDDCERAFSALEMVENLPSQWRTLHADTQEALVRWCVAGLESPAPETKRLGLMVLTNISEVLTDRPVISKRTTSFSGDQDAEDADDVSDDDNDEDDDDSVDTDCSDRCEGAFERQMVEAGIVDSLLKIVKLLGERSTIFQDGERAPLITLLGRFTIHDDRIGVCMDSLVTALREGTRDEKLAAARVVSDLVRIKKNVTRAVEAGAVSPFVQLLTTDTTSRDLLQRFIYALYAQRTPKATEAMTKAVRLLVELATDQHEDEGCDAACEILEYLMEKPEFREAVVAVGFFQSCTKLLKEVCATSPPVVTKRLLRAVVLLRRLSRDFSSHICASGIVDQLLVILGSSQKGSRVEIVKILGNLRDASSEDKIGGSMDTLVKIIQTGSTEERLASATTVANLMSRSQENLSRALASGVVEAFAAWWRTSSDDSGERQECTSDLLHSLDVMDTSEATAALNDLVCSLVAVAMSDHYSEILCDEASEMLIECELWNTLDTIEGAEASRVCAAVLKAACEKPKSELPVATTPVNKALEILTAISTSDHWSAIAPSGAVEPLLALLHIDVLSSCHAQAASILGNLGRHDTELSAAIGASGCLSVLLAMLRTKVSGHRRDANGLVGVTKALAMLVEHPPNAERLLALEGAPEKVVTVCAALLHFHHESPHFTSSLTEEALRLTRILVSHESFGLSWACDDKRMALTVRLINRDFDYEYPVEAIRLVEVLSQMHGARATLLAAGVRTRLKELYERYPTETEARDALKALRVVAPTAPAF